MDYKISQLKIYEFEYNGGKDWVIAYNKKRAIEIYQSDTGIDLDDYKDTIIKRVIKKNWKNYTYFENNPEDTITFEEFMNKYAIEERFFCSTEY